MSLWKTSPSAPTIMKPLHSSWCLMWALRIVWIHWGERSRDFFFFFSPGLKFFAFFFLKHAEFGTQPKTERTPLQTSRVLCASAFSLILCLQIIATPASRNSNLSLTQRDHGALFHSLLPALQVADCLQAASCSRLFLFFQGIIILCFLFSNAWNCFIYFFFKKRNYLFTVSGLSCILWGLLLQHTDFDWGTWTQ